MTHDVWLTEKPDFTEECILICASYWAIGNQYEYTLYQVKKWHGRKGWYLALLSGDGDHWGPLEDLEANLYKTMPLLK